VKERPILFSGPMVRAILEGRKTQTRRLVKLPSGHEFDGYCPKPMFVMCSRPDQPTGSRRVPSPYGHPGDRLWVRETFAPAYFDDGKPGYRADWTALDGVEEPTWKPSIFMPRALSRVALEVVSVRVERLQDITEEDARAEGFEADTMWSAYNMKTHSQVGFFVDPRPNDDLIDVHPSFTSTARDEFRSLWDKINGKKAPWASNPWVWAIEFRGVAP
jgi:hypothetical protein